MIVLHFSENKKAFLPSILPVWTTPGPITASAVTAGSCYFWSMSFHFLCSQSQQQECPISSCGGWMGREDAGSIISPLKKRATGLVGEYAGRTLPLKKKKQNRLFLHLKTVYFICSCSWWGKCSLINRQVVVKKPELAANANFHLLSWPKIHS